MEKKETIGLESVNENGNIDGSDDEIYKYSAPTPQNPQEQNPVFVPEGDMDTDELNFDITDQGPDVVEKSKENSEHDSDEDAIQDMITPQGPDEEEEEDS